MAESSSPTQRGIARPKVNRLLHVCMLSTETRLLRSIRLEPHTANIPRRLLVKSLRLGCKEYRPRPGRYNTVNSKQDVVLVVIRDTMPHDAVKQVNVHLPPR